MNELELLPTQRKKLSQFVLGNLRTLVIVCILFTVVVVMTTDIKLVSVSSITDIGFEFFLILFASYTMYIFCADGGTKDGFLTTEYKAATDQFDALKKRIEDTMLTRMDEFCTHYVDEELRKTRMQYLSVACIPYEVYMEKYVTLDNKTIDVLPELTEVQKKAIKRASRVCRIKLTPEMIMTKGKALHSRSGLPIAPGTIKGIVFSTKMVRMTLLSICMSLIALEVILEPSWTVFAEVCLKLATVIANGFDGRRTGYNNIAVHTVNYVNSQASLMQQAIHYVEEHPLGTATTND